MSDQTDQIIRNYLELDEERQQLLADEAARLLAEQREQ